MKGTDTTVTTRGYEGPAGVHLSPDDCLIVFAYLERIPTAENADIRRRLREFLERK